MKNRKVYTKEFEEQSCRLVMHEGRAAAEVARSLGVPEQTLSRWLKKRGHNAVVEHDVAAIDSDDPVVLKMQIKELTAKLRRMEMERDILKKATAFFAKEQL